MKKKIAALAWDWIGPEIMNSTIRVLKQIWKKFGHEFVFEEALVWGAAFDVYSEHFPDETRKICLWSDAILFWSVGGPVDKQSEKKWHKCETNSILAIRKTFGFNANYRPVKVYKSLASICPLKDEYIENGIDMLIIRELLGDCYFWEHKTYEKDWILYASDLAEYSESQISVVAHAAFKAALSRNCLVTSVDKANVLDISKLWRKVVSDVALEYPKVRLEHMLVDNAAMQIIKNPSRFDVILTSNLFGDILSDAWAALPGSLGLMPSASINTQWFWLYEPAWGSAPDIAGKDIANPIAQIISSAMMLRTSFGLNEEAKCIENAIWQVIADWFRTSDIYSQWNKLVGTNKMTELIINYI